MLFRNHYNITDYAGGFIYKDNALEFISQPEGYLEPNGAGQFNYVYQYKDHLGNIRLSYTNPNADYQNILDSDLTNSMDGWEHNGNVTSNLHNGQLQVNVDLAFEGIKHNLPDLTVTPGEQLNVKLIFDKGTTQAKVRLYFQELDVNGNHLSWNTIDGDLQSGHYDYNYTVNAGHKLVLRIDKTNTHTDEPSSFLIDHISVTSGALELVEENNYYPFGLKHKGYNNVVNGTDHPYGFGGKEENDELGLQWLDFDARNYDVTLGRWMNIDPLAEASYSLTPYRFAGNNPIFFTDPNGLWEFTFDQESGKLTLNREEGDNYDSFLEQSGLNGEEATKLFGQKEEDIQDFLDNEDNASFGTKDFKGKRGRTLKGIEKALDKGNEILKSEKYDLGDNCWCSTISLTSGSRRVDPGRLTEDATGGDFVALLASLAQGPNFDKALREGYNNSQGKLGDAVRFSNDGGVLTTHGSIFLLNKDNDIQMFTKKKMGKEIFNHMN